MAVPVSIGMPVYNGAETIATALTSLLGQNFGDFDLVILDNASTDATGEIARSFAATDRRVTYIRQPRNMGAVANFEGVMDRTGGDLFMWAAADDIRDPSWLTKAIALLKERPDAVLAASDIAMCHDINRYGDPTMHVAYHQLTDGIESDKPHIRYRTVVRNNGWSATYGLIRRSAMLRARRLANLSDLPALGIATDYHLMELCCQGPFAYIAEPLMINQVRERTQAALTTYLLADSTDTKTAPAVARSSLWWQFKDMLWLSHKYRLPLRDRVALQREYLSCLRNPGTLHTHMLNRNFEAALATRDRRLLLRLAFERQVFLAPDLLSLMSANRQLTAELLACQSELESRTRRLERHIAQYGPEL